MRVQAVTSGWYGGEFYQPGDVFDLNSPGDFSNSAVSYAGVDAGVQQFGWMTEVPSTMPLFQAYVAEAIPLFPLQDPTPPRIFVY